MEVLESCGRIRGGGALNVKVAAQTLAAGFCALVPAGDASRRIGRIDLRAMKDGGHAWHSPEDLEPSRISGLAKGIVNNFMQAFFKLHGLLLACAEARRAAEAVMCTVFLLRAILLYYLFAY